jgi:8-oxo-dGTP pyrophosphatase MutT (NUDIX family)
MKTYCLGFVFSLARDAVLLIEKRRPAFQAGLLNGIGGKREDGETAVAAMARECAEETGLVLPEAAWVARGQMGDGVHYHVAVFEATADLTLAQSLTDEPVQAWALPLPDEAPLAPDVRLILDTLQQGSAPPDA